MKILVIDNYDSFTYNLVQYLGILGCEIQVHRNDAVTLEEISKANPDRMVISPGPGLPCNAGICVSAVREFAGQIPILGVCLGHQTIGEAFGAQVVPAPQLMHGKISFIHHDGESVLSSLPNPFEATRYHSLMLRREDFPECLVVNAWTEDDLIMGLRHREYDVFGVQFHPESVMTREGQKLLENFLEQ